MERVLQITLDGDLCALRAEIFAESGDIYSKFGDYQKAIEHYNQALKINRQIGNKRTKGLSLGNIEVLLYKAGKKEEAIQYLQQAIEICEATSPAATGAFRGTLALIFAEKENIEKAFSLLEKKGEMPVEVYPLEHGKFLCKKAKVYHLANQPEKAKQSLYKAEGIAKSNSEVAILIEKTKNIILPLC